MRQPSLLQTRPRSRFAHAVAGSAHGRHDLPWQNTRDPYRIWLSEIMLQQTQVAAVLPYYRASSTRFPTSPRLRARRSTTCSRMWSGLGYYRRAHHLHAAARDDRGRARRRVSAAMRRRSRRCPASAARPRRRSRRSRPASASAILDGNVKRVLARHRGDRRLAGRAEGRGALWREARSVAAATRTSRRTRKA